MRLTESSPENRTLIDALLEDQRQLTAVEMFSRQHENHAVPLQQKFYRDLIPLTAPQPGEQYAFEVDLDSCSGCKACVAACHSLNGLDENEMWREVGTLTGGFYRKPLRLTVTTACHHCVEPGCLSGCPVKAYDKNSFTGIVRHLDDQCIGCQYCSWTCPYDVPKYSKKRGIVRKCDMCQSRLAVGEAPACVQSCPNGAIAIRVVKQKEMIEAASEGEFLPDSPEPRFTIPTTRYKTTRLLPENLQAGDHHETRFQPAHWPLIIMLLLTQLSVGVFAGDAVLRLSGNEKPSLTNLFVALGAAMVGLTASVFHLGRPLQAWRSFLGWRTSWLSREVMAFGAFAGVASLYVLLSTTNLFLLSRFLTLSLSLLTVAVGLASVFCSAMVYHATHRAFWRLTQSAGRFYGTTTLLGFAALLVTSSLHNFGNAKWLAMLLMFVSAVKLLWEISLFRCLDSEAETAVQRSAALMAFKKRGLTSLRFLSGFFGGVFLPFVLWSGPNNLSLAGLALALCVVGELLERYLFFITVAPPKMPGGM